MARVQLLFGDEPVHGSNLVQLADGRGVSGVELANHLLHHGLSLVMAHAALEQGVIVLVVQLVKLGLGHGVGAPAGRQCESLAVHVCDVRFLHHFLEVADIIRESITFVQQFLDTLGNVRVLLHRVFTLMLCQLLLDSLILLNQAAVQHLVSLECVHERTEHAHVVAVVDKFADSISTHAMLAQGIQPALGQLEY